MLPRLVLTCAFAVLLPSAHAFAQAQPPAESPAQTPPQFDAPAYVAVVDGGATLERDGRVEASPLNMPLLTGDRLRTTDGRLEVRFADGGRMQLDTGTSIDVLSDDLVRLADGRIRVSVTRAAQEVAYRVDSPAGSARIFQPGDYRIAVLHGTGASGTQETQLEFAVVSGGGDIVTDQGSTPVRAGERAYASAGLLPSYAYAFNSASLDDFDRWVELQRGTVYAAASQSAQYLPQDLTSYAPTFDQYGDWRYQQDYGYVWYPRVAPDWRPYYYGRWASYPSYGWTWITSDPFGYPTHHYGRWGVSAGLWFWIPTPFWGPAYVSWGYASDYVSWCPLAWNNRAVFSIGLYDVRPGYYSSHDRRRYGAAWTTVRRGDFGHGYAQQHAVTWDRGTAAVRPHFTEARSGPGGREYAVTRNSAAAPIRTAGTRNITAPRYINHGDQIVRSQTGRPVAPRASTGSARVEGRDDTGGRPPQQGSYAQRQSRAWDHPAYRPPPAATASPYQRPDGYAAPPTQAPRAYERPNAAPLRPAAPYPQPSSRGEERAAPRSAPPPRPSGERAAPPRASGGQVDTHAPPAGAPQRGGHGRGRG